MQIVSPMRPNYQSVHDLTPHRPPDDDPALPAQPAHLLQLCDITDRNRPLGRLGLIPGPRRPAHSRCRRRGGQVRKALVSAVPRRERHRPTTWQRPVSPDDAEAVPRVVGAGLGLRLVRREGRLDAALGRALDEVEDALRLAGFLVVALDDVVVAVAAVCFDAGVGRDSLFDLLVRDPFWPC